MFSTTDETGEQRRNLLPLLSVQKLELTFIKPTVISSLVINSVLATSRPRSTFLSISSKRKLCSLETSASSRAMGKPWLHAGWVASSSRLKHAAEGFTQHHFFFTDRKIISHHIQQQSKRFITSVPSITSWLMLAASARYWKPCLGCGSWQLYLHGHAWSFKITVMLGI